MKQKDTSLILIIAIVSMVLAVFASRAIVGSPDTEPMQIEIVEPITSEFVSPGEDYFNEDAINPTQLIDIGEEEDRIRSPFSTTTDQ